MKKDEVKIGGVYEVRLHGVLTRVRIEEAFETRYWVGAASSGKRQSRTHWSATNLKTGRRVQIKSAAKLRKEATFTINEPNTIRGVFNMGPKGPEHADVGKPPEAI